MQGSMTQVYRAKLEQAQAHLLALEQLRQQIADAVVEAEQEVHHCQMELAACEGKLAPADYVV